MKRARTMKRPAVHINGRRHPCRTFELAGNVNARTMRVERGATVQMRGFALEVDELVIEGRVAL